MIVVKNNERKWRKKVQKEATNRTGRSADSQLCIHTDRQGKEKENRVNAKAEGIKKTRCSKKHAKTFVPSATAVLFSFPFSCGRTLVSVHCKECLWKQSFNTTTISGRHKEKVTREVLEAFYIHGGGRNCISAASVALSNKELEFPRPEISWAKVCVQRCVFFLSCLSINVHSCESAPCPVRFVASFCTFRAILFY